ncbi:peptide ABC transporter permease [Asanoa ishikariensis]|uniref:Peptide/nickel transport system permease protein n=1 Tax=Asanoa ishikariensis TaxID=137265 RepID=A0A1H3TFX4_9ACTN|nr:ABC transporter permease [Asanoa ishikariensis]GIF62587.1 peptide ABC transporter permease [Asanoa ishikariensis]SDZ48575.1 peptide/nickel transport system permease protein [Asanoa ishikariensis]
MTDTAQQAGRPRTTRAPRRLPYLVRQLITLLVTLFAITIVIFGLTAIAGDPARDILGQYATDEQVVAFQHLHHLDQPVVLRYLEWLGGVLRGDLGTSYQSNGPVWDVISPRLGPSVVLVLLSWVLTVVISVPIGLWSGVRLRGKRDASLTFVTLIVAAFPEFVLGLMLAILLGVWLAWLPVDSTAVSYGGLFDSPSAYVLPAITIALGTIPYIIRLMRANAREVASETYVRAAVLRGVTEPSLSLRHILPNAAPPVVTALGLQFAGLIGGVVVAETLFGFPGMGQLLAQSAASRDAPVVEALALMIGALFVVANLAADAIVVYVTPKLRDTVR